MKRIPQKSLYLSCLLIGVSILACNLSQRLPTEKDSLTAPTQPVESNPAGTPTRISTVHSSNDRKERLHQVSQWFYYLGFEAEEETLDRITQSSYDLVVIEPLITENWNTDFPIEEWISRLHNAKHPKLVIAYIDIGEAEDWRIYWEPDWEIGDPDWIIGLDPDGWEGDYPVAYWREEWKNIWTGEQGILQKLIRAGFDGFYLDWVEAYDDENVVAAAKKDQVDATEEMIRWVSEIATYARQEEPDFLIIAQNAADLPRDPGYVSVVDAIAQEQVWYDGGADNNPPGDCPLPKTEEDVGSEAYYDSLSRACRREYRNNPEGTLHTSSESYLEKLVYAKNQGLVIFTVDYATEPDNITWIYQTAREMGFIPFVSERQLDVYLEPVP